MELFRLLDPERGRQDDVQTAVLLLYTTQLCIKGPVLHWILILDNIRKEWSLKFCFSIISKYISNILILYRDEFTKTFFFYIDIHKIVNTNFPKTFANNSGMEKKMTAANCFLHHKDEGYKLLCLY